MTKTRSWWTPNTRAIIFWIMVGIAAGITYDLEWFIQRVILFNGRLAQDLKDSNSALAGINTIPEFFKSLTEGNNSDITAYYDENISNAFKTEGLIFSVGALLASFVSGPILVGLSTKKRNYIMFTIPLMLMFSLSLVTIAPLLSSTLLLWTIFTPILGIGYGYRTILDPWGTTDAKRNNVRISWVRAFYDVGAGVAALGLTQLLFHGNYFEKELSYATALPFYYVAGAVVLLSMFLLFAMPNQELFDNTTKTSTSTSSNKTWKEVVKSRSFIIGVIIFTLLIGTVSAFNSVWTNTVENTTAVFKNPNAVNYIGYMKMFIILPRLILAYLFFTIFKKYSFKTLLSFTSIFSAISWISIGLLVYYVKYDNMVVISLIGGIAAATTGTFAVLLGYEWISMITTKNNRAIVFVIFNSLAYGVGAIIFVQINGFLSKTEVAGEAAGIIPWIAMGVASLLALTIIIPLFKSPKQVEVR